MCSRDHGSGEIGGKGVQEIGLWGMAGAYRVEPIHIAGYTEPLREPSHMSGQSYRGTPRWGLGSV